jgi:serine/threonine-protein kinase RsbW
MGPQPMSVDATSMYERLPATSPGVALVRRAVRRFAAGLEVDVDGVVLAVSEAVTNVVVHAYPDGVTGVVEVAGETSPDELTVTVRDHGCGLAAHANGAGFGIEIMRRLAQQLDVADTSEGVVLTMRFRRGGPRAN